jgi:hypothetical protein
VSIPLRLILLYRALLVFINLNCALLVFINLNCALPACLFSLCVPAEDWDDEDVESDVDDDEVLGSQPRELPDPPLPGGYLGLLHSALHPALELPSIVCDLPSTATVIDLYKVSYAAMLPCSSITYYLCLVCLPSVMLSILYSCFSFLYSKYLVPPLRHSLSMLRLSVVACSAFFVR